MTSLRLRTRLAPVLLALACVCAAGWYGPLVTAGIWHVFHPRGWVTYRGLRVRVPWPWTADTDSWRDDPTVVPQGLALRKTPFTANLRSTSQTIFVTVIAPDPGVTAAQQTDAWLETFRMTHPSDSFDSRTPLAVPSGASCLQARSAEQRQDVVWTCISAVGGWVTNFEGHAAEAPVFFEIVAHLKP